MNLDERNLIINRGTWAERLMEDTEFSEVLEELMKEQFAMFVLSDKEDKEGREDLYWLLRGIQTFEAKLQGFVQNKNYQLQEEARNNERREE